MLNFILPILKNPLTRMIGSKVIDGINHKMEKDNIIRAKEIEAVKTVSVEQVRQQEHSIKDEILTLLISAIFIFTFKELLNISFDSEYQYFLLIGLPAFFMNLKNISNIKWIRNKNYDFLKENYIFIFT